MPGKVPLHQTLSSEQETVYMCKFCVEYTNTASLVSVHSEESCPFKACANASKRIPKLHEGDKPVAGPAGGRKVVPMGKPHPRVFDPKNNEEAKQRFKARGQPQVEELARQGRLPEGVSTTDWFEKGVCLQFMAGQCKYGGAQGLVREEGGEEGCGRWLSHEARLQAQGADGGRAVVELPGARRANNTIAAKLQAMEEQEEKAVISRQQAWALKKCGKYLASHKVADRYRQGEFCGRAEGSGLAAIEALIQLHEKKELIGAGWRPKVWSEKLDSQNR